MTLDWFSFTWLPEDRNPETIFSRFCNEFPEMQPILDLCSICDKGMLGFDTVVAFDSNIFICSSTELENGVHVRVPAHGIQLFASAFKSYSHGEVNLTKLFKTLRDRDCRASRIDFAYDDTEKLLSPADFNQFYNTDWSVVTECRSMKFITEHGGDTFYLGRRESDRFLRIYEKDMESSGEIDSIRYEMEFKQTWARFLFNQIADGYIPTFDTLFSDMIKVKEGSYRRFLTIESRKNKKGNFVKDVVVLSKSGVVTRCNASLHPVFALLLENMKDSGKSISLSAKFMSTSSVQKAEKWIEKQVLPALQMLCKVHGRDWLISLLEANPRLNSRHYNMIDQYRAGFKIASELIDDFILFEE